MNTIHQEALSIFSLPLTKHASRRMCERRLSKETITKVMIFGRVARVRGAEIFAVGRKEVGQYFAEGVDLSRIQGVQVVCSPDGSILTVYRNNDFRGLRPRGRCRYLHRRAA
jgi:hypothetical protein